MNCTLENAIQLSWKLNRQIWVMLGTDGKFHLRLGHHPSMGVHYARVMFDEIFICGK